MFKTTLLFLGNEAPAFGSGSNTGFNFSQDTTNQPNPFGNSGNSSGKQYLAEGLQ